MKITKTLIRPRRLANGKYVLDQITYYDETVPGKPWVLKSKREVIFKGPNGRGKIFPTHKAARLYANALFPGLCHQ